MVMSYGSRASSLMTASDVITRVRRLLADEDGASPRWSDPVLLAWTGEAQHEVCRRYPIVTLNAAGGTVEPVSPAVLTDGLLLAPHWGSALADWVVWRALSEDSADTANAAQARAAREAFEARIKHG
jgi:hypothetical protein